MHIRIRPGLALGFTAGLLTCAALAIAEDAPPRVSVELAGFDTVVRPTRGGVAPWSRSDPAATLVALVSRCETTPLGLDPERTKVTALRDESGKDLSAGAKIDAPPAEFSFQDPENRPVSLVNVHLPLVTPRSLHLEATIAYVFTTTAVAERKELALDLDEKARVDLAGTKLGSGALVVGKPFDDFQGRHYRLEREAPWAPPSPVWLRAASFRGADGKELALRVCDDRWLAARLALPGATSRIGLELVVPKGASPGKSGTLTLEVYDVVSASAPVAFDLATAVQVDAKDMQPALAGLAFQTEVASSLQLNRFGFSSVNRIATGVLLRGDGMDRIDEVKLAQLHDDRGTDLATKPTSAVLNFPGQTPDTYVADDHKLAFALFHADRRVPAGGCAIHASGTFALEVAAAPVTKEVSLSFQRGVTFDLEARPFIVSHVNTVKRRDGPGVRELTLRTVGELRSIAKVSVKDESGNVVPSRCEVERRFSWVVLTVEQPLERGTLVFELIPFETRTLPVSIDASWKLAAGK